MRMIAARPHRLISLMTRPGSLAGLAALLMVQLGCSPAETPPVDGSGGAMSSTGGAATGGMTSTGSGTGGAKVGSGGAGTGGAASGGSSSGGSSSGGASTGGSSSGGASTGGSASGGAASGGAAGGGTAAGGHVGGSGGAAANGGAVGGTATGGMMAAGGSSGPGCAGKSYKLCEDFETGMAGAIPTGWTAFKGYGKGSPTDVGLATDQFHSGTMALKSSSMVSGQGRVQKSLTALGATASKHWGRIFYKVQSPAAKTAGGVLHVTFVGLNGTGENRVVDIVENSSNGTHQWLYNNPNDQGSLGSAYNWTFDTAWHCAEWYVDVSTMSYRFFSDSMEVTSIGFMNKANSQMSNYTSVIVGATFYQSPTTPFVIWFDDLAIDDTQIGCK